MSLKLNVAYIEDHRSVKEGIDYLLSKHPIIQIIEENFDFNKMDEFIETHHVNLFILDLQLNNPKQEINGYQICEAITTKYPNIKIIAHSMYDTIDSVNVIFSKGAIGFVSKKSSYTELINAIENAAINKKYICKEIEKKVKNHKAFIKGTEDFLKDINESFTKAEKQILEKIAKGFSTKEIAQQLDVSEKTIETHRKHLFVKAKVKNAAELMAYTYSRKILMD